MNKTPAYNHEHIAHRIAWLRAATLGANDGIISISSLLVGMASSGASYSTVLAAGVAGLVAGAASMAAGEWVSVKSQADAEEAELALEAKHLHENPRQELLELQGLYEKKGLSAELAHQVAVALTRHDALAAHAQDELGITPHSTAKPLQAAVASALTFSAGALVP
ncbi:MAG TPA: VIT1/CCC1 transporter family protein, partial [Limnobacter sp.]|nr:VIT1/CCC1 transporter family protein [Limnobacter sp.]